MLWSRREVRRSPVSRCVSVTLPAAPAAATEDSVPCAVSAPHAPLKAWPVSSRVGPPDEGQAGRGQSGQQGAGREEDSRTDCGMRPGREHSGRKVAVAVSELCPSLALGSLRLRPRGAESKRVQGGRVRWQRWEGVGSVPWRGHPSASWVLRCRALWALWGHWLGARPRSVATTGASTSATCTVPWVWTEESAHLSMEHLSVVSAALAELGPGGGCEGGRGCDWAWGVPPAHGEGPAPVRRGPRGLRGSCRSPGPSWTWKDKLGLDTEDHRGCLLNKK